MDKKAQGKILGVIMVLLLAVLVAVVVLFATGVIKLPSQTVVSTQTTEQIAEATKSGDVASIGIYVRDVSNDNVNTKVAVATYCQEVGSGKFVIDATSSSTSAEITGKTVVGETVKCWAFNSTYQTLEPTTIKIEGESEHIVVDTYSVKTDTADATVYDDTLTSANDGAVNLSVGADGSDSFAKMKFKNNNSNQYLPLGGFYLDVIENTNISSIDMTGSATLHGFDHSSTNIVESDLTTDVSARKSAWDYVFELDDDSSKAGNQVLLIDENDYLETGPITFKSSVGCTAGSTGARAIIYAFTKGYYRETKNTGIGYGHETDASSASVISTDITGPTVYCA